MPFLPVEFRDFFLGDMLCSETYSFGVGTQSLAFPITLPLTYLGNRAVLLSLRKSLRRSTLMQLVIFTTARFSHDRPWYHSSATMLSSILGYSTEVSSSSQRREVRLHNPAVHVPEPLSHPQDQ